jgi:hypothetical protein
MSVTFSGGVTISGGGWTLTPPITVANANWFAGGAPGPYSTVNRILYATDTATATVRGSLNVINSDVSGAGTLSSGWFGGGTPNGSSNQLITYSNDTVTASLRGPLSTAVRGLAATSDGTTYGWWAGGFTGADATAVVQRTTYATDTAATVTRGPLNGKRTYVTGIGTSAYGWVGGGNIWAPSYANVDTLERITYATDTATASTRGPVGYAASGIGGTSDGTTYGWWAGGNGNPSPFTSNIYRTTYATDTATATARGPLSSANGYIAGAGNATYGWFSGGTNPSYVSTIQRITYATDTATASLRGPLTYVAGRQGGTSGIQ